MLNRGRRSHFLLLSVVALVIQQTPGVAEVNWLADVESALLDSRSSGRLVLMKFTADWCAYCKKMERTTFADPAVIALVNRDLVPVLIDFDKHQDLAAHLKIQGLPALLLIAPDLRIVERISGYHTAPKLLPKLQSVLAQHQPPDKVPTRTASQSRAAIPAPAQHSPADDPFAWSESDDSIRGVTTVAPTPNPFSEIEQPETQAQGQPSAAATQPAFEGLCITSVVEERALVTGTPKFTTTYRGRLLYFHDAGQRAKFRATPQKYWPKLDGKCAVTLLETGCPTPGRLGYAAVFRNRIWLFTTRENMRAFITSPAQFATDLEARRLIN